jgi:glycerol kinase
MEKDAAVSLKELNADGGITSNHFVVQFVADLLNKNVATIGMQDVSALGAAFLAGLKAGVYESIDALRKAGSYKKCYNPANNAGAVRSYNAWQKAIKQYLISNK